MTNPANLPCEGTPVRMGGRDYIVPALTMRQVRVFEKDLHRAFEVGPLSPPEDRQLALDIIHAAMTRNYPTMTQEELEDMLDLTSTPKVFLSVMGMSGLMEKTQGEAVAGA